MNSSHYKLFHQKYNVIVVGGGPAGTTAAKYAAKSGAKVILFERDPVIGIPARCGEGVSERGIKGFVPLKGPWIVNRLNQVELIAPDGNSIKLNTSLIGYILDRTKFDRVLGDYAEAAGARIVTEADVTNLIKNNGRVTGVRVNYKGSDYEVSGDIIIGADGVESRVGRWAGIKTMTKLDNMESALKINATNIKINPAACLFYFGHEVAPGGYLWVFPKDAHHANIGIGISGNYSREKPAKYYLEKFMGKYFPHAEWTNVVAGGVPCNPPLKQLTMNNVMLSGDAGHQVNPLMGAGIANALQAGKFAGEIAGEALCSPDPIDSSLKMYTKRWYRARGKHHKSNTRLKNAVKKLDDDKLNELVRLMNKIPRNEWSFLKIFLLAIRSNPDLIIDCIKVFRKS